MARARLHAGRVRRQPAPGVGERDENKLPTRAQRAGIEIAASLAGSPRCLSAHADALLAGRPAGALLLLFVDQFEELFTVADTGHQRAFIETLAQTANDTRLRVLATLRADFLSQCAAEPVLAPLLQAGTFVLGPPGPAALADMIRKPAERAGLVLANGLADAILRDAGNDPGQALPLVAFCLEELHRRSAPEHRLTLDTYRATGGLRGVIGRRAGELLDELRQAEGVNLDAALPRLFRALVHIDATGKAARLRVPRDLLMSTSAPVPQLARKLENPGRLLQADEVGGRATVTLAHEALIQEWPALREWLERHHAQMQTVQRYLLGLAAPEPADRQHAVTALARIGPAAAEAAPALAVAALHDTEADVRSAAVLALERIGPAAVPALAAALSDTEKDFRLAVAEVLGRIGPAAAEAVPALATALSDTEADVRRAAAGALEGIGPAAVPALAAALSDTEKNVRSAAAWVLGRIGPAAAGAVPTLATALSDTTADVRRFAAWALGRIGPAAAEAVPALAAALSDTEADVRRAAAGALGRIGPAAAEAASALAVVAGDVTNPAHVRRAADDALRLVRPAST